MAVVCLVAPASVLAAGRVWFYSDADFTDTQATFTRGQTVHSRTFDNFDTPNTSYTFEWRDPAKALIERATAIEQSGDRYADSFALGSDATLGVWEAAALHNPNFTDWYQIVFLEPANGNNLATGSTVTFKFAILNRDGDTITSDNTANLQLYLKFKNDAANPDWGAASSWPHSGFLFDAATGVYSCSDAGIPSTSTAGGRGAKFGVQYTNTLTAPESGDDFNVRISNTIGFTVNHSVTLPARIVFLPNTGPDTGDYPSHTRFGSTGNPFEVRWYTYRTDNTTLDNTTAPSSSTLIEASDYNPAAGQTSATGVNTQPAGLNYNVGTFDLSAYNAGKYCLSIRYGDASVSNIDPENRIDLNLGMYETFTVQTPPAITFDTYTLERTDSNIYPANRVTRGQSIAFRGRIRNSGQAGLQQLTAATSYLTFNDGTGNTYTAYLDTGSDSLCAAGGTCWLTFTAATVPAAFNPQTVGNLQLVLNGTDGNGWQFPSTGSNYTVTVPDTVTVQYAPDIRYAGGLTQTLRGSVSSPYRYVTAGETNVVLALQLTNYLSGAAAFTAGETITTTDTISFTDGTRTFTARPAAATYLAPGSTVTITFDALAGDTIAAAFTPGAYSVTLTLQDTDDNGMTYTKSSISGIGTHQLTVQAPPAIAATGGLTKFFPAPATAIVTQGMPVQFRIGVSNSGGVVFPFDTVTTLLLGDGTDTYSAVLTATETATAGGGTALLSFALATIPAALDAGSHYPQLAIAGTDANGRPYLATLVLDSAVTVQAPAAISYVSGLTPRAVVQGQSGISFSFTVQNTGGASLTLSTGDTLVLGDGTDTVSANLAAAKTLAAGGTAALTFTAAAIPAALDAGSRAPQLQYRDTDANGYATSGTCLSGADVTVYAPAGLRVAATNLMPAAVSAGQTGVSALLLAFGDSATGTASGITLSSFILTLTDTTGATLTPSGLLSAVRIRHANGVDTPLLQSFNNPASGELTVDFGGTKQVAAGETYSVLVTLDFAAGATTDSTVTVRLAGVGQVAATDSVSGSALTPVATFPLRSETATVRAAAQLSLAAASAIPEQTSQGRDMVRTQTLTFTAAGGGCGDARLTSFRLACYDPGAGTPLGFGAVVTTVTVASGALGETHTYSPGSSDTSILVDFGGTPLTVAAGSAASYTVYLDISDTAVAGTDYAVRLAASADITASDAGSGNSVGVTGSFPAASNAATIINKATMNAESYDSMPATVTPGQTLVRALQVRLSNDIGEPGASSDIYGFWLEFQDTTGTPLDVDGLVSSVTVKDASQDATLYDEVNIDPGDTMVYIDFSVTAPGSVVPTPPPLYLDIFLNIDPAATESATLRVAVTDTSRITARDANSGELVVPFATYGWASVRSKATTVAALTPSIDTFKDTACLLGATTFSTGQRVYARHIGLAASEAHGVYWYNSSGTLMRSDTYTTDGSGQITGDSYDIPGSGPAGLTWEVRVYRAAGLTLMDTTTFIVQNRAALTVGYTDPMPATVIEGQSNVSMLTLTFGNSASSPAGDLKLVSFPLLFQDSSGTACNIRNLLSEVRVYEGATLRHQQVISTAAGSDTLLTVNFTTDDPDLVTAGSTLTLTVKADIAGSAAGNTLTVLLGDSTAISVRDENSGDTSSVTRSATPSWGALASSTTLVQNAATLTATQLGSTMPDSATRGQANVAVQRFRLNNTAAAPARTVKLSQLQVAVPVRTAAGADTSVGGVLTAVILAWPGGSQTVNNPSASPVTFDLGGARFIAAGDSLSFSVAYSFAAAAPAGYRIGSYLAAAGITATDSTAGTALTAGGAFPLAADTTVIEKAAVLQAHLVPVLPATVARGQQRVPLATLAFGHNGDSVTAGTTLAGTVVQFRDDLGDAQNINGLLTAVYATFAGGDTQTVSVSSDTTQASIVVPSAHRLLTAGETLTVALYADIGSGATAGTTLRARLAAASAVSASDANGAGAVTCGGSFPQTTGYTTVQETATLAVSSTSYLPATVSQGQQLVRTQRLTFTATGATVQHDDFTVSFRDGSNTPVNVYGLIDRVYAYNGSETFSTAVSANPTVAVTFSDTSAKRFISTLTPVTYDIIVDLNSNATAGSVFRTQVSTTANITALDSNTQQPVGTLTLAATPLRSDSTTVQTKARVDLASASAMPVEVSQGQALVRAQTVTFTASSSNAPRAGVALQAVTFAFTDAGGSTERTISALADTLTVNVLYDTHDDTYAVAAAGYDSSFLLDFTAATFGSSARTLAAGETAVVHLLLTFKAGAAAGTTLRTQVTAAAAVDADDSNTSLPLAAGNTVLAATPLAGSATTIRARATLAITQADAMPAALSLGQAATKVQTLTFSNGAAAGNAGLALTAFSVKFTDAAGNETSPADAVHTLTVRDAGTGETWAYPSPASVQAVTFSGSPRSIAAAGSASYEVYLAVPDTGYAGKTLRIELTAENSVTAGDALSGAAVIPTGSFPLRAGSTTLQDAARLFLSIDSAPRSAYLAAATQQGATDVRLATYSFHNRTAAAGGAAAQLHGFTLAFTDAAGGQIDINNLLSTVRIKREGNTLQATIISSQAYTLAVDFDGSPQSVAAGDTAVFDIYADLYAAAPITTKFRCQITDTAAVDYRDINTGVAATATTQLRSPLPLASDTTSVSAATGSAGTYFDAGRTTTQDTFSQGQIIYSKFWGLLGLTRYAVRWRTDSSSALTPYAQERLYTSNSGGIISSDSYATAAVAGTGDTPAVWTVNIYRVSDSTHIAARNFTVKSRASLRAGAASAMPATVVQGEGNVHAVTFGFADTAPLDTGAQLKLTSFTLSCVDTTGAALALKDLFDWVKIGYQGSTYTYSAAAWGAAQTTQVVNFDGVPQFIPAGSDTRYATVFFAVTSGAPPGAQFRFRIADAAAISAVDRNSQNTLTALGPFPLQSDTTQVLSQGALTAGATAFLPAQVTQRQADVRALQIRLANTATAPANGARLTRILIALKDQDGADTDFSYACDTVTVVTANGTTDTVSIDVSSSTAVLTVDYTATAFGGAAQLIDNGDTLVLDVYLTLRDDAPAGARLRLQVADANAVTAADSRTGAVIVTGGFGSGALQSAVATVRSYARLLLQHAPAMPATAAQGSDSILSTTLYFGSCAPAPGAAVKLYSFPLTLQDSAGLALDPRTTVEQVYVRHANGIDTPLLQVFTRPSGETLTVDFGGTPRSIAAGETLALQLLIDLYDTATVTATAQVVLRDTAGLSARDANADADLLPASVALSLPLASGALRVIGSAALALSAVSGMPSTAVLGQQYAGPHTLHFAAAADRTGVQLTSFTLAFQDTAGAPLTAGNLFTGIAVYDGTTWETFPAAPPFAGTETGITVTFGGTPQNIRSGETLSVTFYANLSANVAATGKLFRLALPSAAAVSATDTGSGNPLTATAAAGFAALASDACQVQYKARLNTTGTNQVATTVSRGQDLVFVERFTFTNSGGGTPGRAVHLGGFSLHFRDADGDTDISAYADAIRLVVAGSTYTYTPTGGQTTLTVAFTADVPDGAGAPIRRYISAAQALNADLYLDIRSDAPVGRSFQAVLQALSDITATDSVTGTAIAFSDRTGDTPVSSVLTTVQNAAALAVNDDAAIVMPSTLSQGEQNLRVHRFIFSNSSSAPAASADLSAFRLWFQDGSGSDTVGSDKVRVLTVKHDANTLLSDVLAAGCTSVVVSLPAADRYLDAGETYGVSVYLTLHDTATPGATLRTAVKKTAGSGGITASDTNTGLALTAFGGEATIAAAPAATLKARAVLRLSTTQAMPDTIAQGDAGIPALTVYCRNEADSPGFAHGAGARLEGVTLNYYDTTGSARTVDIILSGITVKNAVTGATLQTVTPTGASTAFTLGGARTIAAGDSLALAFLLDCKSNAAAGITLTVRLTGADQVTVRDAIAYANGATTDSITAGATAWPLASDTATVVSATGSVLTYRDSSRSVAQSIFSRGQTVYARGWGLFADYSYALVWDAPDTLAYATVNPDISSGAGLLAGTADSLVLPANAPVGSWRVRIMDGSDTKASATFTVQYPATLQAAALSFGDTRANQGQTGILLQHLVFSDTADSPGATVSLDSFTLSARAPNGSDSVDLFGLLNRLTVKSAVSGATLQALDGFASPATSLTVTFAGTPQLITRGESLTVALYADLAPTAAPQAGFRLALAAAGNVYARDNNSLAAVTAAAPFPLLSDSVSVRWADTAVSTVATTGAAARSDGSDSVSVTVALRGPDGSPVSGFTVLLSSSRGDTDEFVQPGATAADGTCTGYVRSRAAGDAVISACVSTQDDTLTGTATVTFIANVAAAATALGSRTVAAGETAVTLLQLTLTNYATVADSLATMTVRRLGSSSDGELAALRLYRDSNGNDTLDIGTDVLLDTQAFSSAALTFTGLGSCVLGANGDSLVLFVTADVADTATPGDTVDAYLAAGDITLYDFTDIVPAASVNSAGYYTVASANSAPTVTLDTPVTGETYARSVYCSYTAVDADDDACTLFVEYSANGGAWLPATISSGETASVSASAGGTVHTCEWNAATNLPDTLVNNVRLRLTLYDGSETGASFTSGVFGLNNRITDSLVLFNEIMYYPGGHPINHEWFELANVTADTIDLGGWKVGLHGASAFTIPANYARIPPYGYAVVSKDTSAAGIFSSELGHDLNGVVVIKWGSLLLNNAAATIELFDTSGARRDAVTYSSAWGADGDSYSLEKRSPSAFSDSSASWTVTTLSCGTPGHANSVALSRSTVEATAAQADGTDTAVITVTLLTDDLRPVPNHRVTVIVTAGSADVQNATGYTDARGQYAGATATSAVVNSATVRGYCTAEDTVALSDSTYARFVDVTGYSSFGDDTYISSVSSVNALHPQVQDADTWTITGLNWSNDGTRLGLVEGDFSAVRGVPGSDRRVYVMDRYTGESYAVSSRAMNPCPFGRVCIADFDQDGDDDVIFGGYVTGYPQPFWGIMVVEADASDTWKTNNAWVNRSPEAGYLNAWTPDVVDSGIVLPGGYQLNAACSQNGDILLWSGKYAMEVDYVDRLPGNPYTARVIRGYASGQQAPGSLRNPRADRTSYRSYYWAEPVWSPDGRHLAMTRYDFREISDGDAVRNVFQSEIWVLKNAANYIAADTIAEAWGAHMVRISPPTISDTVATGVDKDYGHTADHADTVYFGPQWSRDGKIISYSVDREQSFNLDLYLTNPNAALSATNFDVVMRYVGNLDFLNNDGIGSTYDTYAEQVMFSGTANEISFGWPDNSTVEIAAIYHEDGRAAVRTYGLNSEVYLSNSGGILLDHGLTVAVVGAGDTLAEGTIIRTSSSGITDPGTAYDTMVATGVAREFWPEGFASSTPIMVVLHYDAADLAAAGLTDGSPEEVALKVFWWNDAAGSWEDYGGTVDPVANTITFLTTHFSQYALFRDRSPVRELSSLTVSDTAARANGSDSIAVRITLANPAGPMAGLPVKLQTTRGDSIVCVPAVTAADGTLTAYVSSTVPGTAVLECTNLRAIFPETFVLVFSDPRDGIPDTAHSSFTADRAAAYSDGLDSIVVALVLRDHTGTPVAGAGVVIGTGRADTVTPAAATTDSTGSARFRLSSELPGSVTLACLSHPSLFPAGIALIFSPRPDPFSDSIAVDSCSISLSRPVALADGVDAVTVVARVRSQTRPLAGVVVRFATDRGDSIVYLRGSTDSDGYCTAVVRSTRTGSALLSCLAPAELAGPAGTFTFLAPADTVQGGLVSEAAVPALTLLAPDGTFDTAVGFVLSAAVADTALLAAANARDAATLLPDAFGTLTAELHARRLSDGAYHDTGLLRPARIRFAIPPGLAWHERAALRIFLLDERDEDGDGIMAEWLPLPTTIDDAAALAWTDVPHFSIYRLGAQVTAVGSLNDVVLYPNPWRRDRHAGNGNAGVKLLLPVNRTYDVRIYTVAGDLVDNATVSTAGGLGSYAWRWDVSNARGQQVASGTYLVVIRDTESNESIVRKIAILQ